jgi:glutamine amidotransferase PdxT
MGIQTWSQVIVAVRKGVLMATAFHPELTADARWWEGLDGPVTYAKAYLQRTQGLTISLLAC